MGSAIPKSAVRVNLSSLPCVLSPPATPFDTAITALSTASLRFDLHYATAQPVPAPSQRAPTLRASVYDRSGRKYDETLSRAEWTDTGSVGRWTFDGTLPAGTDRLFLRVDGTEMEAIDTDGLEISTRASAELDAIDELMACHDEILRIAEVAHHSPTKSAAKKAIMARWSLSAETADLVLITSIGGMTAAHRKDLERARRYLQKQVDRRSGT